MADMRIRGAKAGQKQPRKPNISKDTAASISTAKLLYGLGEGEIYGLADGARSIRLDGTPLVDDVGNPNFEGVTWDFRNGSNDQEYIKGFPDVSNETPINVELRSSQPWIKAFNDTQISAVRVRLKWNRLSETDGENGDVKGYKIDYAIDLQTDGGAYQTVLTTKIQDKTSAGYERTHRIDLPQAKTGWQLRVRRITPNSTSDLIQDTMMIDAVAEVIDVKLSYPNTALLGVQYNAELFNNIAKMSVRVKGKIIRVPDNYDPVARTYTGIWTGNFKDAYSNNPAWIFYDLCTQWRGGLGERLDETMIDRWSLYALGQYCDQPVSDGQGGLEPRFTCNVYLQKQEEAYTVLQNIAGIFRAMSFWTGERIMLDADVPQDSIYTYSSANIVGGVAGIQYSGTRNRDRHTLAKVAWDNPNNDYQTEYEYIRDEKAMSKFGVKVLDLSAFGCTSQAQAQRAGLWALKTEQLETRQVTFSVGLDGAIPRVGNIISLSDEAFAGRANGGRVSTVNDTQRIIELDREVTASVGDVLIVNGGSGKSERRNISNVVGNRITVTAGFTSAEPEHVWAIETADLKLMRFRVMSITENDDATYAITAIQHEPQKYNAIDYGTDVKPTEITIVNPDTVDAPDTVSIESRHREVQGQTITTLIVGWAQVSGAVSYDVEWRKDDGTWIKVPRTGNVSVEIEGVYSGNYMARVRSVSAFDVQSQATTSILTEVKGKIGLPPTVVGLTAAGVLFGMDLKWGFQAGSGDAAFTEIQVGSAPNVNVATLGQYSYPTDTHTVNGLQGNLSQSYRARLVDKLGFKSPWSAWVTGTTDASADKVMDLIQGQIDESSLNQALTSKIEKIDTNSSSIGGINTELDKAKADIAAADKVIADNKLEATNAVAAANKAISDNKLEATNAVAAANAEIADSKLLIDANKAKLVLTDAEVAEAKTKVTALETDYNGNKASVSDALIVLTNKDKSLASDLSTLTASYGASETKLVQDLKVLADKDVALNSLITTLDSEYETNKASVSSSLDTLTNKDTALTNSITDLTAVVGTNTASISAEATARADADKTITSSVTALESDYDANKASVTNSLSTLTDKDTALTNSVDALTTRVGTAEGTIISNNTALVNKDIALTDSLNALTTDYDDNKTTVSNSLSALSTADTALGKRITTLDTDYKGNKTAIRTELTAVSNKTNSTATSLGTLTTTVGGNTTKISQESTARSDADTALGNRITATDAIAKNAQSRIGTAETTIASNTQAIATTKTDLSVGLGAIDVSNNNLVPKDDWESGNLEQGLHVVSSTYIRTYSYIPVTPNTKYTISVEKEAAFNIPEYRSSAIGTYITNTWAHGVKQVTITTSSTTTRLKVAFRGNEGGSSSVATYNEYLPKVEKGAKATGFVPSGFDVNAGITKLENAIVTTNNSIVTTKEALTASYKQDIKDIKIGGTNLYPNSDWRSGYVPYRAADLSIIPNIFGMRQVHVVANKVGDFYGVQNPVDMRKMLILQGEEYTLSWYGIGNGTTGTTSLNYVYIMYPDATSNQRLPVVNISTRSSKELNSITFTADTTATNAYILFGNTATVIGEYFRVGNVMLEKGNKPSEWSPSIFEVEEEIATNKADIETTKQAVADANRAIAQTKTELTTEYETAIKDIDIGGLNLLKTSGFVDLTKGLANWGDTTGVAKVRELNGYNCAEVGRGDAGGLFQTLDGNLVDDVYTISFDARSAASTGRIRIGFLNQSGRNSVVTVNAAFSRYKFTIPKTDFEGTNGAKIFHIYAYAGEAFFITNIQVERGNTATAWKPSPKDLEVEISKNAASITTTNAALANANQAIATSTNTLRAEYKQAVEDIKIGGTNLYSNGDWTAGYTIYASATTTITSTAPFYIPSLQMTARVAGNQVYGVQSHTSKRNLVILQGEEYTVSWYGIGNGTTSLNYIHIMRGETGGNQLIPIVNIATNSSKVLNSFTFIANFTTNTGYLMFANRATTVGEYFRVGNVKVEKGNKPTEYSPSPLDTYAALEEQKTVTTDINGKMEASYTLRTDVGGRISGFGLMSSATQTDFAINADKFYVAPPTGSSKGISPFMVLTSPRTINGTSVPAGTYIESAFIHNGSIDTLQVAGNAITAPKSAFTEAAIVVGGSYRTIQTLTVPSDMGATMLTFNCVFSFTGFSTKQQLKCRILKNGVAILTDLEVFYNETNTTKAYSTSSGGSHAHRYSYGYPTVSGGFATQWADTEGSGAHSHTVVVENETRNSSTFSLSRHDTTMVAGTFELQIIATSGGNVNISNRYIHSITMRR